MTGMERSTLCSTLGPWTTPSEMPCSVKLQRSVVRCFGFSTCFLQLLVHMGLTQVLKSLRWSFPLKLPDDEADNKQLKLAASVCMHGFFLSIAGRTVMKR